ncbi:MAG: VOC family protein [Microscillaceae bacterium]|nr:VOC family protein [Microscillaceae bacterium]
MLISVIPRLPACDLQETKDFYTRLLDFSILAEYENYLLLAKDQIELHFYTDASVNPATSDRMVYIRVSEGLATLYAAYCQKSVPLAQEGALSTKPWGQEEFAVLDPNGTLLTFGQAIQK